ncbi:MAG: hypothetical protein HF312_21720, partial [Ignavibacteria bacterium]|nr:hypothetical protein [Ignavibacteria bacterium]
MSFETATRQNIRKVAQLGFLSGQRVSKDLPRTGLLANLFIRVEGTLTVTGSPTLKANQYGRPFGLIDRLSVKTNNSTSIVDVTGHGLALRNMMDDNAFFDVVAANMVEAETSNPTYQFGFATGANPVAFTLKVPIVVNDRDPIGLILLQNGETLVTVNVDWANPSNLFTLNGGTVSFDNAYAHVTMEYFDVPVAKGDYPNLAVVHTLLEDAVSIDGVGTTEYQVPRGNIYQRLFHRILLNDAPAAATDIDRLRLKYNQSLNPYAIDSKDVLAMQRYRYKRDLLKGAYVWDFAYQGQAGFGGHRDLVNSAGITDFISAIDIATGATLGTNNNKIFTLKEQLMPI